MLNLSGRESGLLDMVYYDFARMAGRQRIPVESLYPDLRPSKCGPEYVGIVAERACRSSNRERGCNKIHIAFQLHAHATRER